MTTGIDFAKISCSFMTIWLMAVVMIVMPSVSQSHVIHVPGDYPLIQAAMPFASDWDTILVASGTYPGLYYIGTNDSPEWITLMGSGWPNGTVITGVPGAPETNAFQIHRVRGWRITNFEITQCGDAIHPQGFTKGQIDHNYMHHINMAYWSCAIEGDSLDGTSIHHNLVTDCEYGGFFLGRYHDQIGIHVYNNTIDNIYGYEGIQFLQGYPQNCVVTNNIITNCGGQGVEFAYCNQGNCVVSYNCVYHTNGPWQNVTNPGPGNVLRSPQFLMQPPVPQYYYLDETSPCIDTGNPDPFYNDPNGSRSDMGAFPSGYVHVVLEIAWANAMPGDVVDVPITISDVSNLDIVACDFTITYPEDDLDLVRLSIPDSSLPYQAGWTLNYSNPSGSIIASIEGQTPLTGSGLLGVMSYTLGENVLPDTVWNIRFQNALLNNGAYEPHTTDGGIRLPFEILYGDVNLNGYVTLTDASMLFNFLAGSVQLNQLQQLVAEVSGLAGITAYDGALITQHCFQQFVLFPVEGGNVEMYAEGILSIPDVTVVAGDEAEIPINLQNGINVAAAEMDVTMGGAAVELQSVIGPGQGAWFTRCGGVYPQHSVYIGGSEPIQGNHELCRLVFQIPDTATGSFSLSLYNIMLNEVGIPGEVHRDITIQPVGFNLENPDIPVEFSLASPYPNPFNPTTCIEFAIPITSEVSLRIYNTMGQLVEVLESGALPPGRYTKFWNASKYSSGVYIAELTARDERQYQKLMLVK